MNGFDLALIAIVVLSTLFAFVRGVVRELIALVDLGRRLRGGHRVCGTRSPTCSRGLDVPPAARHVLAFVLMLVVGADRRRRSSRVLLSGVVRAIGLGFVDRMLGAAFGLARGVVVARRVCADRGGHRAAQARLVAEFDAGAAAGA